MADHSQNKNSFCLKGKESLSWVSRRFHKYNLSYSGPNFKSFRWGRYSRKQIMPCLATLSKESENDIANIIRKTQNFVKKTKNYLLEIMSKLPEM